MTTTWQASLGRREAAALNAVLLIVALLAPSLVRAEPELLLGISLRNAAEGRVGPGEPLRMGVELRAYDESGDEPSLELRPTSGTWADAVDIRLLEAGGRDTGVVAIAVGNPDQPYAVLDGRRIAGGTWRIVSGATGALSPGSYILRARFSIPVSDGIGWTGEVFAEDVPIEIETAGGVDRRVERLIGEAHDTLLDGRLQESAVLLDQALGEQPDNVRAWTLRAAVSEQYGNVMAALQCVQEGLAQHEAQFDEPNADLHAIEDRLLVALRAQNAPGDLAAPAGHWSWPPRELLTSGSAGPVPVIAEGAVGPRNEVVAAVPDEGTNTDAGQGPVRSTAVASERGESTPQQGTEPDAASQLQAATATSTVPTRVARVLGVPVSDEGTFMSDPAGQWATSAVASSEYGHDRYNAMQATGAPDVESYSDNPNAWCHSGTHNPEDWLELTYGYPVVATELRVRQNYTPGTIARIEAFAADGRAVLLWQGSDPNVYADREIAWFVLRFPPTPFPVVRVKLTLNISAIGGWKQIDAVQLVGN